MAWKELQEHCSHMVMHTWLFCGASNPPQESQTPLQANTTTPFFSWEGWCLNPPLAGHRYPQKLSQNPNTKCLNHFRGHHKRSLSVIQVFLGLLWTISRTICFFKCKGVITTEFSKFFWLYLNYCAVLLLQITVSIQWHNCDITPCCLYRHLITLTVHTNPSLALVYAQILTHLTQNLYFMLGEGCW